MVEYKKTSPDNLWVPENYLRVKYPGGRHATLKSHIAAYGILDPLDVVKEPKDGAEYKVLDGAERRKIALELKISKVSVKIHPSDIPQAQQVVFGLKAELGTPHNPIERAKAYNYLHTDLSMSVEEIATLTKKSANDIAEHLAYLELPEDGQKALAEGHISRKVVRVILKQDDSGVAAAMLDIAVKNHLKTTAQIYKALQDVSREREGKSPLTYLIVGLPRDELDILRQIAEGKGVSAGVMCYKVIAKAFPLKPLKPEA